MEAGSRAAPSAGPVGDLIERSAELDALDAALERAAGGSGQLVVVEGPAGIGKSRLVAEAARRARARGMAVLTGRGTALERWFAFGVALQVVEPALRRLDDAARAEVLTGSARLALPLLEPTPAGDAGSAAGDFPLLHGLTWCVANLGERQPLLLVVDDAQWADASTLRWCAYLAHRVADLPVALVVAVRSGEPDAPEELLAALSAHPAARRLRPEPLSRTGVGRLVAGALGAPIDARFAEACARATDGNPYLLTELVRVARAERLAPDAGGAERIAALVPEAVLDHVAARLARLPEAARRLAEAASVLGEDAHLRLAGALSGVGEADAAPAIDALHRAGILASGDPLRFQHPLTAASVYERIPTGTRALEHLRAAELLRDDGAAADRVAAHLLRAPRGGRAWVVDTLAAAAAHARGLGAPADALRLLRRALEEPPPPERRASLLLELGRAEAAAADPAAAGRFSAAVELLAEPRDRAMAWHELGRTHYTRGEFDAAREAYARGLAELGDRDDEVRAELRADDLMASLLSPTEQGRVAAGVRELMASDTGALTLSERKLLATLALVLAVTGQGTRDETLPMARHALGGRALLDAEGADGATLYAVTGVLFAADELVEEDRVLSAAVDDALRCGSLLGFATAVYARAWPRLFLGRVAEAVDDAERAVEARRDGWGVYLPAAYGALVAGHLERDELERAAARAAEAEAVLGEPQGIAWAPLLVARGMVRLAEGRPEDALADFERSGAVAGDNRHPMVLNEWRSCAGVLRARLHDPDAGRALIVEELEIARRYGTARSAGVALRRLALLERGDRAVELLAEAVETLEGTEARLNLAHALVDLGAALRRANRRRDAGRRLGDGLELARACGALALERRAVEELEVAGAAARRRAARGPSALTPAELRVATLAADGLTNREIAERLFVTRKAVEFHLRNAYGKLGIASRGELAAALQPAASVA